MQVSIFTAMHLCRAAIAISEMSVRLSARPSVKCVNCEKNERKVCQHLYSLSIMLLSNFLTRRIIGGGDPFYLKFWVKLTPLERQRRFLIDIRS